MRDRKRGSQIITFLGCAIFLIQVNLFGITLEEIKSHSELTPQKFASFFSNFEFQFRSEVQSPDRFLATESGDCDDFATLAANVLTAHGYTTRLVAVRMPEVVHVVCYVEETNSYLDFNNRANDRKTMACSNSIDEIADKVAKSFNSKWSSASEFTYRIGMKRLVSTTVVGNRQLASTSKASTSSPKLFTLLTR
ncbi:MAG: transglutaminase domain-containing protein [Verrucomicrobiales bacterium]